MRAQTVLGTSVNSTWPTMLASAVGRQQQPFPSSHHPETQEAVRSVQGHVADGRSSHRLCSPALCRTVDVDVLFLASAVSSAGAHTRGGREGLDARPAAPKRVSTRAQPLAARGPPEPSRSETLVCCTGCWSNCQCVEAESPRSTPDSALRWPAAKALVASATDSTVFDDLASRGGRLSPRCTTANEPLAAQGAQARGSPYQTSRVYKSGMPSFPELGASFPRTGPAVAFRNTEHGPLTK